MRNYCLLLLTAACSLTIVPANAQDTSGMSDAEFFAYTRTMKTQGNEYYLLSNRLEIKRVADEMAQAIRQRRGQEKLTAEQEDSLMQDVWKLWGDYHYENSDLETSSYGEAEKYFKMSLDYARSHDRQEMSYHNQFVLHRELAQLYYKQNRYDEALDEMREAYGMAANYYSPEDDGFLDIQSQLAICLARNGQYEEALEYINDVVDNYKDTDTGRYGEALRKKAKIMMLRQETTGKPEDGVMALYKTYFDLKKTEALRQFANMSTVEREQYWMRLRPFVTDCYRTEDADAAMLYDVTLFAKGLLLQLNRNGGGVQALQVNWQQVQQRLPEGSAAIEFIQYEKAGKMGMAALVLGKTGQPRYVQMASPDEVMAYDCHGEWAETVKELLYHVKNKKKNPIYNDSTGLFKLLWNDALVKAVGSIRKVYFAPDGYLHQLAIEYMVPDELSGMRLYRLSSTRRLMEAADLQTTGKALVVGGVDYKKQAAQNESDNDTEAYRYIQQKRLVFNYLENSGSEVDSIILSRGVTGDVLLLGENATEQRFRELSRNYPIIHISTHGVFGAATIPQGTDLKPCLTDNSLSECILALAGLQTAIDSENFDPQQMDGVLSAREISSLDLSHVSLVVLACCETALGYVTSDGVYGIQRGLKNAGAKVIIATLWDIDDEATKIFMMKFHHHLAKGDTIGEAFHKARAAFIAPTAPECEFLEEPCYRDAFILIDALE